MSKSTRKARKPDDTGESIVRGALDALAYVKGDRRRGRKTVVRVPAVDVRALRARFGLSQQAFARRYGFSIATLRDWEQGRRRPRGPARVLLAVLAREPKAVERALAAA
jgi:putative transcriptional regulator